MKEMNIPDLELQYQMQMHTLYYQEIIGVLQSSEPKVRKFFCFIEGQFWRRCCNEN